MWKCKSNYSKFLKVCKIMHYDAINVTMILLQSVLFLTICVIKRVRKGGGFQLAESTEEICNVVFLFSFTVRVQPISSLHSSVIQHCI